MKNLRKSLLFWFFFPQFVFAATKQSIALPIARIFPETVGILFPGANVAAGVNAGALPLAGKGTSVQASFSPAAGGEAQEVFGSVANTNKKLGIGLGYLGYFQNTQKTHGIFAGAGFNAEPVSFGLGIRDASVSGKFDPSVDLGLVVNTGNNLTFGGVFYHLESHPQLAAGIGFMGGRRYNVEANVLLPSFSDLSGNYTLTGSANMTAGIFGIQFCTSYYTAYKTFTHSLGLLAWLTENVNLTLQFTSPHRWRFGTTIIF